MTAFEYVLSIIGASEDNFEEYNDDYCFIHEDKIQSFDDGFLDGKSMRQNEMLGNFFDYVMDGYIIKKTDMEIMKNTEIHIDEDVEEWCSNVKYPYYRIRGKKIPAEQAKMLLRSLKFTWGKPGLLDFCYDFIFEDGAIGVNSNTSAYPDITEIFLDAVRIKSVLPYPELIIAVSRWDQMSDEAWEKCRREDDFFINNDYEEYDKYTGKFNEYKYFEKNIKIGIWIHDDKIEILNSENAAARYVEYTASETYEDKKRFASKLCKW